jgi:hypothetical protein
MGEKYTQQHSLWPFISNKMVNKQIQPLKPWNVVR